MLASKSAAVGGHPVQLRGLRANVSIGRPARTCTRPRASRPQSRRGVVRVEAIGNLFSFLKPPAQVDPKKRALLVGELLESCSVRKPDEAKISELVDELAPFGVKRPVRSQALFGEYRAVFSTSTSKAQLILEQPNSVLEISDVTSLGFLPAKSILSGELNDVNDSTFEVAFTKQETKGGLGGTKTVNTQKRVTIVYLDSDVLVTQQESQGSSGEDVVIYSKVKAGGDKEEASPDAAAASSKKTGTGTFFFGGGAPKEGTATVAERTVKRKMAEDSARSGGASKLGTTSSKGGAISAREQLDQLAAELREKQALAKEATKNVKDEERRNATLLRASAAANAEVAAAAKRVQVAQEQVQDAMQGRAKAEQDLKAIAAEVQQARSKLK